MGLLDLFKRTASGQTTPLSTTQVDSNWQKIMDLFPTPAAGTTDVGKVPALKADKTGFEYVPLATAGAGIKRFPKESSLTSAHIGLLAMQKVIALNNNPQSIADFEVKAVVADTTPAVEGIKGVYKLSFDGLKLVEPVTKLIKIEFTNQPNDGDYLNIKDDNDSGLFLFYYRDILISSNDIQIGVDLAETISNTITFFISNIAAIVESSDANSITFSMRNGQDDSIKYFNESYIVIGSGSSDVYTITTERELTIDAASKAQAIYNLQNNYLLQANTWDSNNNGRMLIDYASIFRNDSGQPNGTFGPFGLRYYSNDAEVIAALNWALNNTSGSWFNTMFDIVTPLAYNANNSRYEMTVRNKTAPTTQASTYFQSYGNSGVDVYTNVIANAQSGRAERIPYTIIGKVVGIDGTDALIDTSYLFDVKMCSQADGAFGILPYSDDLNYGNYISGVIAWRNGTVIDLAGYFNLMQNAGFQGDNLMQFPLLVGGYFRPVNGAGPGDQVAIDGKFILFGN